MSKISPPWVEVDIVNWKKLNNFVYKNDNDVTSSVEINKKSKASVLYINNNNNHIETQRITWGRSCLQDCRISGRIMKFKLGNILSFTQFQLWSDKQKLDSDK